MRLATRPSRLALVATGLVIGAVAMTLSITARPAQNPQPYPIFVSASAQPGGDGMSWATAFNKLEDGIAAASPGWSIWLAQGSYVPQNPVSGFQIPAGVSIYGAFLGTEMSITSRAGSAAATILEGDLGGGQFVDHVATIDTPSGSSGSPGVTIDGVQIQHGHAIGSSIGQDGGGIRCLNTDLTLVGSFVVDNEAMRGGGIFFDGGDGGSHNVLHVKTTEIRGNFADDLGGGLFAEEVIGIVGNTRFLSNDALNGGGGAYLWEISDDPTKQFLFFNDVFWSNWVDSGSPSAFGGALKLDEGPTLPATIANAKIVNCTFSDNYVNNCADGQAVYVTPNSRAVVHNSILAFNYSSCTTSMPINLDYTAVTMEYSDIFLPGSTFVWPSGNGNIAANPKFRRHLAGYLTLDTQPYPQSGSSPCVESADDTKLPDDLLDIDEDGTTSGQVLPLDLLRATRVVNRWENNGPSPLDMGAYEHP